MDDKEFERFMTYLFNEHVRTRSRRFREYFHPMEWGHRLGREWERLISASNLLRYINHHCDEEEIYRTITRERIVALPAEIRRGANLNRFMLEESGFMEVIDTYYDEIIEGMKLEHMPEREIEVMRQLGSSDPESELSALIYIVKSRSKGRHRNMRDASIGHQLENIEQRLEKQEEQLKAIQEEPEEQPKKPKRWFKGLGQIAQGSALSIANIGLAMGAVTVPVAAETAGWGAIVSSITGVGMVLNGVGEFRGE